MGDPVDARSDVYSLGCILYLMLVGVPAADAPTREGMLKRRLNESAPHPMTANEALPPELDAIVVKALATSPADRFQSAAELRDALAAVAPMVDPAATTGTTGPSACRATSGRSWHARSPRGAPASARACWCSAPRRCS
jgi:serine/threonine-protein kinase